MGLLAVIVTTSVCIFALKNEENVVYAKEEISGRFNPETLQDNEHMHVEIDESGDKVPVPNGYVGSRATGENEINTGYVIYEGEEEVNDSNVEEAQKTRNQYVWIPVPDASTMYRTDANGKKWGKLYEFTTETGEGIDPVTGAKPLNMIISNKTANREPDITSYDNDSVIKRLEIGNYSAHVFLIQLEQEFNRMIVSIEKYGGFYIGRYETGEVNQNKLIIKKGNSNLGYQNWYTMYKKCKELKKDNNNIATGMLWSNQWDRTLMWLIESGNKTKEDIIDSFKWGNFKNTEFEYMNNDNQLVTKKESSSKIIPTGSSEYTKANNIYDLAGNVYEWTMEQSRGFGRAYRGGYMAGDSSNSVKCREDYLYPNVSVGYIRSKSNAIYKIIANKRWKITKLKSDFPLFKI